MKKEEIKYRVYFKAELTVAGHPDIDLKVKNVETFDYSQDMEECKGTVEVSGTIIVKEKAIFSKEIVGMVASDILKDEDNYEISTGYITDIEVEILDIEKEE